MPESVAVASPKHRVRPSRRLLSTDATSFATTSRFAVLGGDRGLSRADSVLFGELLLSASNAPYRQLGRSLGVDVGVVLSWIFRSPGASSVRFLGASVLSACRGSVLSENASFRCRRFSTREFEPHRQNCVPHWIRDRNRFTSVFRGPCRLSRAIRGAALTSFRCPVGEEDAPLHRPPTSQTRRR